MFDEPKRFSEEDLQSIEDAGELYPLVGRETPYLCPVYFYTDLENDDFPSLFKTYSHHPGKSDIHHEVAKKAFEIVLLGLS